MNAAYVAQKLGPTSKWVAIARASERKAHGTYARYVSGCKCFRCRVANSHFRAGGPRNGKIVSAEAARQHVLELAKRGMGYKTIGDAAGVNHNILWGIRQGTRPRARQSTIDKILAVDFSAAPDGLRVPAGPTWEILDELIRRGFAKSQLAAWLGYTAKGKNRPSLQLRRDTVTVANAGRVVRMKVLLDAGRLIRGGPGLPAVKARGRGGRGRRRHSGAPRCACGKFTLRCAKARSHHCLPLGRPS